MQLERLRECSDFRQLLTSRCKALGLSLEALSERLDMPKPVLLAIQQGLNAPHASRLWRFCEVLDVDPGELLWSLQYCTTGEETEETEEGEETEETEEGEDCEEGDEDCEEGDDEDEEETEEIIEEKSAATDSVDDFFFKK